MLTQTLAIVLNYRKYSDSSIIVHCLTEKLGRQSFIAYGIGGRKKPGLAQFQPLTILDLQLYTKANRSLQKLKEARLSPPLIKLSSDLHRQTISLFLAEILSKSITEEYSEPQMFDFLKTSILFLDEIDHSLAYFHQAFLLRLAKYLGILPDLQHNAEYIDLNKGTASINKPAHQNFINKEVTTLWLQLLHTNYNDLISINPTHKIKTISLESILILFETHVLNFGQIKSYNVLKEIFNE